MISLKVTNYLGIAVSFFFYPDCNRVVRGHRGVITTPNFPNPYPHNRNCTWIIQAPRGNSINASFSDFVVEEWMDSETNRCLYDFVEVSIGQHLLTLTKPGEYHALSRFSYDSLLLELVWRNRWSPSFCNLILPFCDSFGRLKQEMALGPYWDTTAELQHRPQWPLHNIRTYLRSSL